ncbi:uncharacterized protein LOC132312324 [Cornus florida]|uniref:uncharacterized protein LOC132312324 n=1 Tax=Cornus florida TaxID=4283 RepID=UPI00289BFBD8|nr:uncharacterized protein LOC132312324 [Cornus florida]
MIVEMASACVNNIGMSPENFLDCPATYPSYGWLSPRISFSREIGDGEPSKIAGSKPPCPAEKGVDPPETSDPEVSLGDFEFRLEDPVTMLPADELFSDGKLVPLQLSVMRPAVMPVRSSEIRSPETAKSRRRTDVSNTDPYLFSPKAPRCSSRWKELLGLKKLYQNTNAKHESHKTSSSHSNPPKSLKHFLHRSSKSSNAAIDSSLSLPLLKDTDSESVSISSRLSLSSSSSGHEHDDLPRLSLDSEKHNPNQNPIFITKSQTQNTSCNPPRVRVVKPRAVPSDNPTATRMGRSPLRRAPESTTTTGRGASVDSPRMNSSGKIVFQGLERSSSSPSSFNGGPRFKHRGMERSYSANVRITPVLNVPVCSLRGSSKSGVFGFPLFSTPQKREVGGGGGGGGGGSRNHQHSNSRNRTDRT